MAYVDGFLLPVPRRKLAAYRAEARKAGKIWMELGALEYRECAGDDVRSKGAGPLRRGVRLKAGEVIFFSWIVYRSRRHRDSVNKRVMKDPRIQKMMNPKTPVFDMRRMGYGGFKTVVDL